MGPDKLTAVSDRLSAVLQSNRDTNAADWWVNLSINQQRALESKYYPNLGSYHFLTYSSWVKDMWEMEGKPKPQELIPVKLD